PAMSLSSTTPSLPLSSPLSLHDALPIYDASITENTRVSYPLHFISNMHESGTAGIPKNIFFLTCDAFGVLPPIAKLNAEQAMYQDRKSTRLNSSHVAISYAVFCLKKKKD